MITHRQREFLMLTVVQFVVSDTICRVGIARALAKRLNTGIIESIVRASRKTIYFTHQPSRHASSVGHRPSQTTSQERSTSVIKIHRVITGTILLAVCGFMMIVWAHGRPEPPLTQASVDSIRAVKLRFTFASGDSAN